MYFTIQHFKAQSPQKLETEFFAKVNCRRCASGLHNSFFQGPDKR